MVLSLVTPIGSNFIKDWPAQNTINCDRIDEYAGPCLTTHPLQSYTPILSALTTPPVLGTGGFIRGFYYKIFDQIYTWGEFRFGTAGINAGSSIYTITLPFAAKSLIGASANIGAAPVIGNATVWDDSADATRQSSTVHLRSSTLMMFSTRMGSTSRVVTHNTPFVWAINDGMMWYARYQRDPTV